MRFTAIKLENGGDESSTLESEPPDQTNESEAASEERILFINNLPIDTTVEEIDQVYSRFGPLDSIQLYNLRPDLDPGPLSRAKIAERRRKKKKGINQLYPEFNEKYERPRTPVYGMLRFQTDEGYQLVTSPAINVFGIVLRRHPVMNVETKDMNKLFIEDIPPHFQSIDLEHTLAQILHPNKMHIMLDGMRGVGLSDTEMNGDHQGYSMPSSCEVKLDDFHTALQAYNWFAQSGKESEEEGDTQEMNGVDNNVAFIGEGCQVHWFRSPKNSMDYWTREL